MAGRLINRTASLSLSLTCSNSDWKDTLIGHSLIMARITLEKDIKGLELKVAEVV